MFVKGNNLMPYSSATLNVIDNTGYQIPEVVTEESKFTVLIPGFTNKGETNVLKTFSPGEAARFLDEVGYPNYNKGGVAAYIGDLALNTPGVGVHYINLRAADARHANCVFVGKYKVTTAVPKKNAQGAALYLTPEGVETTVSSGNTAIVRDVLTAKYEIATIADIEDLKDFDTSINTLYNATPDVNGFKTYPLFGFMYAGASAYGNTPYFRLLDKLSDLNGAVGYDIEFFDGENTFTLDTPCAMYPDSLYGGGLNNFITNVMENIPAIEVTTSGYYDDFLAIIEPYFKDEKNNTIAKEKVEIFSDNLYQYEVDGTSVDITGAKAIKFASGSDGTTMTKKDETLISFFKGEIVKDIADIIRYKINLIPDIEYSDAVKAEIKNFLGKRFRTTKARLMLGNDTTFESAVTERGTSHLINEEDISYIAKVQSAMMNDPYTKRSVKMPASYYDFDCIMEHFYKNGNMYTPLAGADVRWGGYKERTMVYPGVDETLLKNLANARINVVCKDNKDGGFMSSQMMNTFTLSDQTEMNNSFLIGDVVTDVALLIHKRNYKFIGGDGIKKFQEDINDDVVTKYRGYLTSVSATVTQKATTGFNKGTSVIKINIDFKDIGKNAEVILTLNDNN